MVNGIRGMVLSYERALVNTEDGDHDMAGGKIDASEKVVRLLVALNPPLIQLPDISEDVKDVREKKPRKTRASKKIEEKNEGEAG
jgi:hypothetical protein